MVFELITAGSISEWESYILPVVYDELTGYIKPGKELLKGYFCIGAVYENEKAGAAVVRIEEDGDLNVSSIYVSPRFRRRGIGKGLINKTLRVAREGFAYEAFEYGTDIFLKTVYCLSEDMREVFEDFLKAAGFTEFYIFEGAIVSGESKTDALIRPKIRGASAEIHFFFDHDL